MKILGNLSLTTLFHCVNCKWRGTATQAIAPVDSIVTCPVCGWRVKLVKV